MYVYDCVCIMAAVLLLESGEVLAFGSNQYGQLGLGDTAVR